MAAVYLRVVADNVAVDGSPQVVAVVLHLVVPTCDYIAPGDLCGAAVYVLTTRGRCRLAVGTTTHCKKGLNIYRSVLYCSHIQLIYFKMYL